MTAGDSIGQIPIPFLPGIDCEDGGIMLETGTDLDGNGMLDYNEITSSEIICNGDGRDSIANTYSILPGIDCEDGGIMLETGTDLDEIMLILKKHLQKDW